MSLIDVLFDNDTTNDDEHLRATIIMMMITTKVRTFVIYLVVILRKLHYHYNKSNPNNMNIVYIIKYND